MNAAPPAVPPPLPPSVPPPAPPDPGPAPAAAHARPVAAAFSLLWPVAWVLLGTLALLAALGFGLRWLADSEAGTRWLLPRLPGVQVEGVQGALGGTALRIDRLVWTGANGQQLELRQITADGLRWHLRPRAGVWVALEVQSLRVATAGWTSGAPAPRGAGSEPDLALPVQLFIAETAVDEVRIDTLPPLTALTLRALALDSAGAGTHGFDDLALQWRGVALRAQARIGTGAGLPLTARAQLAPAGTDEPAWAAVVRAEGPLAAVEATATLRGRPGRDGSAAPALDARARIAPLAPWPLQALALQTEGLDLSALAGPSAGLPQTRLSGRADVQASARDAPVTAEVALENALPGRWNEGRLPVRTLTATLRGLIDDPGRIDLTALTLRLADGGAPNGTGASRSTAPTRGDAGVVTATGRLDGARLQLDAELSGVHTQRLDSRAAAMRLGGPLRLVLQGLPTLGAAPAASASATAPAPAPERSAELTLDLTGRLDAAPQPVRLTLRADATPQRLRVLQALAQTGSARAAFDAMLERGTRGEWALRTQGELAGFDPLPWWPGTPGSAWARGSHRLSGTWELALRAPPGAERMAPLALLPRLAGTGVLRVGEGSRLAGVPMAGELRLGQQAAAGTGTLQGAFEIGGNRLTLEGRGNPSGSGEDDSLRLQLVAEQLATLAPLAALHPALAPWVPRQGSANATVTLSGRWPALRTEGQARVLQVQAGTLSVASGQAEWQLEGSGEQRLQAAVDATGLRWGEQRAQQLRARLRGNAAAHRIEVDALLPAAPAAAAGQLLAVDPRRGTRALLRAEGAWLPERAGGGRWRARVERLALLPWGGGALPADDPGGTASGGDLPSSAAAAPRWAEARDLALSLSFGTEGALQQIDAAAGRLQLADIGQLRWDEMQLDLRGAQIQGELRAEVPPLAVAPLLARLMPQRGWAGDLRVGAQLTLRARERFEADVVLERSGGDLVLEGDSGTQRLGLEQARLTLRARDGLWEATQVFRGRTLGEIDGRVSLRTAPENRWPDAAAPLQGRVELRVPDIGIWNNWVPAGWRLAGEVRSSAEIGGRFGAPEFTGRLSGKALAVRNLLQGVNVSDGTVEVALEGDRARIETFTWRGGEGRGELTGSATLGAEPVATLALRAERLRVLGRVDRQLVVSGDAALTLRGDALRLEGRLKADQGLFDTSRGDAPGLDADVTVRRPGDADPDDSDAPAVAPPRRNIVVDLALDLGDQLRVRGRGLDTALRGQLRLRTPGGRPALEGTVVTEGGTYVAYGQKLEIERGIVAFAGPMDNPRLDVLALRANSDIRVGVAITGTAQSPRVRLYADPEMSDTEKLSWLVLGRAPDGLGRTDTALLQRAAVALLAGEGEGPGDAMLRALGIDDLSLRTSDGDTRETVVTLGKQLSRRWYLGYERGVNATSGTWQLIYRIAQRLTVRAQSGMENSIDIIWVWRRDEAPPLPDPAPVREIMPRR